MEKNFVYPISTANTPQSTDKRALAITFAIGLVVIIIGAVGGWLVADRNVLASLPSLQASPTPNAVIAQDATPVATSTTSTNNLAVAGLQLDPNKNYGNKYADGLLPVGDSKYVTDAAKKGYIYVCRANFVPANQAGAQVRGPWFVNNNMQWDLNKKSTIAGNVTWEQKVTIDLSTGKRQIVTNDLPDHHTGVFPVAVGDPARKYDANPNKISEQALTYNLENNPTYSATPNCMGGEVGVMLTGIALFNGFDAGGRDAGAWEVQDTCDGHPQNKGEYHYHTLSRCIEDVSVQKVIGFALDGFPITGPQISAGNILTTNDLDECHGIVSTVNLDGKEVNTYHYVMTQDFPYSASCFRGKPIMAPAQH